MKTLEMISIPVTDQERAKEFYAGKIGFAVITEAPFANGQKWIQLGLTGSDTSVTLVNWFEKMPAGCLQGMLIKTDNIEQEVKELESKDVVIGKIEQTPWGRFASFKDPDGNGWSLHES